MESNEDILMLNSSMIALKQFQKDMEGEAEKAGLLTEDDVVALCRDVRRELSGGRNEIPHLTLISEGGANTHPFTAPMPLHELLATHGIHIAQPCGGLGRCGKCQVRASGFLSPAPKSDCCLACQTMATGNITVTVQKSASERIITHGQLPPFSLDPWGQGLGVAVDIGTTTVAAYLYDLQTGSLLQCGSAPNPQSTFGADVITRMDKAEAGQGEALRKAITGCVSGLIASLREGQDVHSAVITGNTAMLYLLCGHSPSSLMRVPFAMDQRFGCWADPQPFGLSSNARVYLPNCLAAYIGADITTALLASGLFADGKANAGPPVMLADIGTNGEIVLCANGKLYACATAAGPAFEGAGISMGMTARDGAIAHITKSTQQIIGDVPAVGICGSGIVDALALMLDTGALDETGALEDSEAYRIPGTAVEITQADVRAVQLAKAAIHAGMRTLIHEAGLSPDQVETLLIAGGFGSCIDPASAERIGLIPPGFAAKARAIGNAAGMGASMALLSSAALGDTKTASSSIQIVELAANPFFMDAYIECMMFQ
ncbi:MAG: ASKHA domain-containing protein [Clostridia bacterium]|nr:ASKHA domain-containing protein [Clostridia bacterium]